MQTPQWSQTSMMPHSQPSVQTTIKREAEKEAKNIHWHDDRSFFEEDDGLSREEAQAEASSGRKYKLEVEILTLRAQIEKLQGERDAIIREKRERGEEAAYQEWLREKREREREMWEEAYVEWLREEEGRECEMLEAVREWERERKREMGEEVEEWEWEMESEWREFQNWKMARGMEEWREF